LAEGGVTAVMTFDLPQPPTANAIELHREGTQKLQECTEDRKKTKIRQTSHVPATKLGEQKLFNVLLGDNHAYSSI